MTRTTPTTWHGATTRRLIACACALASALVPTGVAQARLGDLDPSFDGDGVATPAVGGSLEDVTTRPDGRPVAVGTGIAEAVVVQLTNAGEPDTAFDSDGVARFPDGNSVTRFHGVALRQGGVLVAGDRGLPGAPAGETTPIVQVLSESGQPGRELAITGAFGEAHAVAPVADDKMLVAGWRRPSTELDRFFVARLNDDGSVDQTFNGGIVDAPFPNVDARAFAMAVDADQIVLAGQAGGQPALALFNSAGNLDRTIRLDGAGALRAVRIDEVGRITAAGSFNRSPLAVRRLANGDPDFLTIGTQDGSELRGLVLDGPRALVAGGASQLLLSSLDAAGTPEPALAWRSFPGVPPALGAALGPDGTVYTAGGPAPFVSRHLPNAAPTAALTGPAQVTAGSPAAFDAGGSTDPEGEALRYGFDLDGDGSYEFDGGGNALALRSFPAPGTYTVGVRVTDPRGRSASATRAIAVVAAAVPPPQPVLGKQGVAKPLSGIVRYRLPGTKKFVRLRELTAIPNGTEIDARKGRLLITVLHDASGRLDGARFFAGRFIFRQGKGATPITTLKLSGGSFENCTVDAQPATVAVIASVMGGTGTRSTRRVRKLWGDGRGRFRTRGRYGAATVRGTKWLTLDRCDGTKVRVVRGKVSVQDLVRADRRPKLVRAGQKTFVPYKR